MEILSFLRSSIGNIIGGLFLIGGIYFTYYLNKKDNKLLSEEVEETVNADGSRHKKEKRIFK
ncbi:hypothetical protein [Pedobacter sp. L105]|uniref:hypothetical protein n=1 Tax=Pedobacter sp. L105 TaxID=1641871 RepID=UPI00131B8791|nr:hypothetical protein [Pedobacter sp. L105]